MSKFTQFVSRLARRSSADRREHRALGERNLVTILGIVAILLGAVYFVEVNRSATKSFAVHALVQQQADLMQQKRALELQQAQLTALSNLQDAPVVSQLVATTHAEYLNPTPADVARR